ncbi:hypothetical protein GQ42DRAFT_163432 [Ramicandelaber brevisporus]|nr:hypothetical protein GQ42DRAFT_163432 [Ramicandelaber brevisporus]
MAAQDCFPVRDLGFDLLEHLTLFFNSAEGVSLLTVSSQLHDVFARSVWRVINRKTIDVAEPTRSAAFKRYGHLVRTIALSISLYQYHDTLSWHTIFPNTACFNVDIRSEMSTEQKQRMFDAIAEFHGLRSLEVFQQDNRSPFDLDALGRLLVARSMDRTKQRVQQLRIVFTDHTVGDPWGTMHRFVSDFKSLNLATLQIGLRAVESIPPTSGQLSALRPYLFEVPAHALYGQVALECYALPNLRLFGSSPDTSAGSIVHPLLADLNVRVCCASSYLYEYTDIVPSNFPQLQQLTVTSVPCTNGNINGNEDREDNAAMRNIVLQPWSHLTGLGMFGNFSHQTFDNVLAYHPNVTKFNFVINENLLGGENGNTFMIERIVSSLTKLHMLGISSGVHGGNPVVVDTKWSVESDMTSITNFTSSLKYINISGVRISSSTLALLLKHPTLHQVKTANAVIDNIEDAMTMLNDVQQENRQYSGNLKAITLMDFFGTALWPIELLIELIKASRNLKVVGLQGYGRDTIENLINHFPNIEFS